MSSEPIDLSRVAFAAVASRQAVLSLPQVLPWAAFVMAFRLLVWLSPLILPVCPTFAAHVSKLPLSALVSVLVEFSLMLLLFHSL